MAERRLRLPPPHRSLSARLLVLTIFFVMLAEVFIYAPSIARFRKDFLEERLAAAHLATLALEAADGNRVTPELERALLHHVGAHAVELKRPGEPMDLMLGVDMPQEVDATFDLREGTFFGYIWHAFATIAQGENRVIRVRGASAMDPRIEVEIVMDEEPMCAAMLDFSSRILALSIIISLFTAALVYLSLQFLTVLPMRRMAESIMAFREAPEDVSTTIQPVRRSDEVGLVTHALAEMQTGLRAALRQRAHLAAMGAAVTKISHDLRGILATARLLSDRLAAVADPEARRITPALVGSIDKAVDLCEHTLDFARAERPLRPRRFDLAALGDELAAALDGGIAVENGLSPGTEISADRDQLFRLFLNLARNAAEAGAGRLRLERRGNGAPEIAVTDDGPGLPPKAQARLFEPFEGSTRPGGTGLGLAISREIARAHGGDLRLERTGPDGTVFVLSLPRQALAAA